jgi:uncharacterized membrane protein
MMIQSRIICIPIALSFALGCGKSPEGGQPGTKDSFTITAPVLPVMLKQGDKQTVTIKLDRDSAFQDDVTFSHEGPKGLDVDIDKAVLGKRTFKAGEPGEFALSITAAKDATPGDHIVKVIATPAKGTATHKDVKVKVEATPK